MLLDSVTTGLHLHSYQTILWISISRPTGVPFTVSNREVIGDASICAGCSAVCLPAGVLRAWNMLNHILTPHWPLEVMEVCRYSDEVSFHTKLHLACVIGGNSNKVAKVLHSINDIPQDSKSRHVDTSLHIHSYNYAISERVNMGSSSVYISTKHR